MTLPQDSSYRKNTCRGRLLQLLMPSRTTSKSTVQCWIGLCRRSMPSVRTCKRTLPLSSLRKMDADRCGSFEWKTFVEDLKKKAPTLHAVFSCIVSRSDQHPNSTYYPGLCMSVAILLKERNREMSGLQNIVSLLLYSSHVDKQVSDHNH